MNKQALITALPPYQGSERMIERRQTVHDILREIMSKHVRCRADYDRISTAFWKGNVPATCKNIFDYCHRTMRYKEEPVLRQTVKSPAAIIVEGPTLGNDCKHYASFICGICDSLHSKGYPISAFYRYALYKGNDSDSSHIFAVVCDSSGNQYWVDPVLRQFNARFPVYYFKQDKFPPMANKIGSLYDINGISNATMVSPSRQKPHWFDTYYGRGHSHAHAHIGNSAIPWNLMAVGKKHKAKKKHHGLHLKIKAPHIKIQPGKLFMKVSMLASRKAFLALVRLNIFDLATRLYLHGTKDKNGPGWKKLSRLWTNLGGSPGTLSNTISEGLQLYNRHHPSHQVHGLNNDDYTSPFQDTNMSPTVGVVQLAAAAAVIAAAAPVIAALKSLLKSFGVNTDHAQSQADAATEHLKKAHNDGGDSADDDGSVDHGSGITTKVVKGADGSQTLQVDSKDGDSDGGPDVDGAGTDTGMKTDKGAASKNVEKDSAPGMFNMEDVKQFFVDHKNEIATYGTLGLGVMTTIGMSNRAPKKSRGTTLLIGIPLSAALAYGVHKIVQ